MKVITVDNAIELDIHCKQRRTFDLTLDLDHSTTGKAYKLQVKGRGPETLTFAPGNGLTIQAKAIKLHKSPAEMNLPTGTYNYDLIEISGANAINMYTGIFLIQPSYTDFIPATNNVFPFTSFPMILS